jgi:formate transporter
MVDQELLYSVDALPPAKTLDKAVDVGVSKTNLDFLTTLTLAVLAGAFISLGAVFSTTVTAGAQGNLYYGAIRLLSGFAFSLGLILVVCAGAELFTGNNLTIMAAMSGKVTVQQLLRNWLIVYMGNFFGALATAVFIVLCRKHQLGEGAIWLNALNIGHSKNLEPFLTMFARGIMGNALVCLAVWLSYSARSMTDKILSIIFPITAFVAAGFEHSVANMYFVPVAIFARKTAPQSFWGQVGATPADYPFLTWQDFFVKNLVPVTLGNMVGGVVLVGAVYWLAYKRSEGLQIIFRNRGRQNQRPE